jgi:hypothetical protein
VASADAPGRRASDPCEAMFFGLAHRHGHRGAPSWAREPDGYLTDGRRLFYVVSRLAAAGEKLFAVEDCVTLDIHVYGRAEFDAMELRAVRPTDAIGTRTGDVSHSDQTGERAPTFVRTGRD